MGGRPCLQKSWNFVLMQLFVLAHLTGVMYRTHGLDVGGGSGLAKQREDGGQNWGEDKGQAARLGDRPAVNCQTD